jgi:transcriptional regulator with XRE-family HTH domain
VASQQNNTEKFSLFSGRLRARLAKLGIQQNELADRVGVSPGAVNNWLSGVNAAKGKHLRRLADVLNCDAHWLSGDESPTPHEQEGAVQAEVRLKCHRYIDQLLDNCHGDTDSMTWVLVELKKHFPVVPLEGTRRFSPRAIADGMKALKMMERLAGVQLEEPESQPGGKQSVPDGVPETTEKPQ